MTDEEYAREVGSRVKAAREKAGLTQAQLSEGTGIAVPHLSRLESGPHLPSLKTLRKVADTLGVAVCDLLPPKPKKRRRPEPPPPVPPSPS